MAAEAGVADVWELKPDAEDGLLDRRAGEARGPGLVEGAVAVGRGVEGVVHDEVELVVRERGLHVAVVRVLRPRRVREVEHQWVLRARLVRPVASEEGREARDVQVDHCP